MPRRSCAELLLTPAQQNGASAPPPPLGCCTAVHYIIHTQSPNILMLLLLLLLPLLLRRSPSCPCCCCCCLLAELAGAAPHPIPSSQPRIWPETEAQTTKRAAARAALDACAAPKQRIVGNRLGEALLALAAAAAAGGLAQQLLLADLAGVAGRQLVATLLDVLLKLAEPAATSGKT